MRARLARFAVVMTALVVGVGWLMPGTAQAASTTQIADGFAGPLQLAVGSNGDIYVAQDFAGVLRQITKKGVSTLVTNDTPEIAGVAAGGNGIVFYTADSGTETNGTSFLRRVLPNGNTSTIADLSAYEASVNPDQINTYGVPDLSPECAAQWPVDQAGPPRYTGVVDSH